jgi:hypothetical protein
MQVKPLPRSIPQTTNNHNCMSSSKSSSGGIGFAGLLTIVFITLKLLGKIEWSWGWVFAPVWLPLCAALFILLVCFLISMLRR